MASSTSLDLDIPAGTRTFRTSLSLPADLAVGISLLAKRLGVSQSALVTALLSETIPDLQSLVDKLPESPESEIALRFRGKSIDIVTNIVRELVKKS